MKEKVFANQFHVKCYIYKKVFTSKLHFKYNKNYFNKFFTFILVKIDSCNQ